MSIDLQALVAQLKTSGGIQHKQDIQRVANKLREAWPNPFPNGDDSALIPDGENFKLLAMEGFINRFVEADPWFAGWCGVMVNLSDIAAMGGRPIAVVNALWDATIPHAEQILQGMAAASHAWRVPVVGGHTNLRSAQAQLAVAILGETRHPLSSFSVRPGQTVMAAINLNGRWHPPGLNWDAATQAEPAHLRRAWALLPTLAEDTLIHAAKDISQAGLAGTLVMMLESAGIGAEIDVESIPRPDGVGFDDWLCAFPSFGFLMAVDDANIETVRQQFTACGITAAAIGRFIPERQLYLQYQAQRACYWDLETQPLTGMTAL
ncbi:TPA: sll0787 family AIR synthase-like protein [Escherichia coli]|uniref:Phosphoribosylformylglycinamidine synthase subunit PurL n=2 Tax=Klebsiella pneumoniae complex TaxID=3390273 RepID=A0A9P0YDL9_KLEVA|nr:MULTISPECIES: sll0787 family AIR synthase-like protein [Enterobacteriaceae]MBX4609777.1 sll0787 family AIR synthase-like protein [Klebsiella variicola]MCE0162214.1 sll0787 family AIR synthase-like protein [Klebsiella variicola subsp. variicola]MCJ8628657.1 sll0787 family AIR synthase-like protein [Escherichia coli]MRL38309.1 sll0787 family AIR synthase-like protein [Klebsiella pneumoniae]NWO50021.1 sll0787 family AIR synthase-like protein [Klebsiella pneumoniae]